MGRNRKDKVILGFTFVLCTPINGPLLSELGCQVKTPNMMIVPMQRERKLEVSDESRTTCNTG